MDEVLAEVTNSNTWEVMGERKFVGEEGEEELGMARAAPLCGCV